MKSGRPEPFAIVGADGEYTPEFEAQFASYLASLEADVDYPTYGGDYREMLAMDREDLRAVLAVTHDLMEAGPAPRVLALAPVVVAVHLILAALIAWYVL